MIITIMLKHFNYYIRVIFVITAVIIIVIREHGAAKKVFLLVE